MNAHPHIPPIGTPRNGAEEAMLARWHLDRERSETAWVHAARTKDGWKRPEFNVLNVIAFMLVTAALFSIASMIGFFVMKGLGNLAHFNLHYGCGAC